MQLFYIYSMKNLYPLLAIFLSIPALGNDKIILPNELNALIKNGANELKLSFKLRERLILQNDTLSKFELSSIIPYKNGLIIYERGGGKLLFLNNQGNLNRLDKSNYSGERFGAFVFENNDTIYSLGGYGFWHITGAVRIFNEKTNEWGIINVSRNVRISNGVNSHGYYDSKTKKLYVIYSNYKDEYIKHSDEKQGENEKLLSIQIFDLKTKDWNKNEIYLNRKIGSDINDIKVIATLSNGIIVNSKSFEENIFLSFENNKIYKVPSSFALELSQLNNQEREFISYVKDSSIYFYDIETKKMKFITLNNLIPIKEESLYHEKNNEIKKHKFEILFLAASIMASIIIFLKMKKKRSNKDQKVTIQDKTMLNNKVDDFCELLDNQENAVLEKLLNNYQDQKLTSIEEINKILNIEKRQYRIRNNIRADLLKIINKKFIDYSGINEELIIRVRSDFDKRYFQYSLNERFVNKIRMKN